MPRFSLRTVVGSIGLAVAVTIFLSVPAGYFVVGYASLSNELHFKSHLTADRLAKYVYRYRQLWQYQAPRLAELIELDPHEEDNTVALEVRDLSDKLVIGIGPDLKAPRLIRSQPIVVGGETVGRVVGMSSLQPLWLNTAFVALLSALLGFAAYFAVRVFPLRVLDRTLSDLRGAQHDLAAQNEHLRISKVQLSDALEIARAGHWECDFANDRFTFNDNFYQIFHTTAKAVGGYTMTSAEYARRFVYPDDLPIVDAEIKAAIETNDPNYNREFEHRIVYADGKPGHITVRFFIVKDEHGRTIKSYGVNQDITERKRAQLALADSKVKLSAALTNMSQGLAMFDADEKLVMFNSRFATIFGVGEEKIALGMTTRMFLTLMDSSGSSAVSDLEGTLALQQKSIRQGGEDSAMVHLADGRSILVSHRSMPGGGFVATFDDITARLLAEERIKHLAHHDALTDLPNRVTFYERIESVLNHLRRSESIAILSLDLDHFKAVNDTLGHPVGDLLLKAAGERMRSCVRSEDVVARLGGDEFAIVQVPTGQPLDIAALAARLIEVVGAPYDLDGHQVVVGVSIGIALASSDSDEPDMLMKNADLALYRAKADGGSIYRFFEIEMDTRMQERRALELDLRKAVVNGEFELYYQPIIGVKTQQITSCEALIRWHHPERGTVAPLDFIPVAEATGLIVPIGEWVLRQACAEAARWPKNVTIAVNVSPAQFKSRNLVPTVISALAASGLPAARLELEITEMVLLQETEGALAVLHQLRDLGIRIAMDDFGTGYSSLGYLRSFPFDKIKIDQSFIRDLPGKKDSLAIVRAVVGLSSSMGITTTAEGVETKEQLASVTAEGCDEVQGYLYSWPKPAAEVEKFLAEQAPKAEAVA